jgi:glucosyl-3-phosphoglycerate synthase
MPDTFQPASVLSLPLLGAESGERLETDLTRWTKDRPLALILPCHVRDLESEALANILNTLAEVPWISRVVVGLDGAGRNQYHDAVQKFSVLRMPCEVLHHDVSAAPPGKGRNLSVCAHHLSQSGEPFAVAMHDCDIRTYSRSFLARLCWPVMHPEAGIAACKGYYVRNAGRLHGRVFRLMFQPLLQALAELAPAHPWPAFLQSLRYPLSGELCVETGLLQQLEFASGWGVEVSLLHGLYRRAAPRTICQAELCAAYDHKHHDIPVLIEMAAEVAGVLAETMQTEDALPHGFDPAAMLQRYGAFAKEAVRESALTAEINGLEHDRESEASLALHLAHAVGSLPWQRFKARSA